MMSLKTNEIQCFESLVKLILQLTGDLLYFMKHHKSIRQAHFNRMVLSVDVVDVYRNL